MTDSLDMLPESVRTDMAMLEAHCEGPEFWLAPYVQTIRYYCTRLARENAAAGKCRHERDEARSELGEPCHADVLLELANGQGNGPRERV